MCRGLVDVGPLFISSDVLTPVTMLRSGKSQRHHDTLRRDQRSRRKGDRPLHAVNATPGSLSLGVACQRKRFIFRNTECLRTAFARDATPANSPLLRGEKSKEPKPRFGV
jgi:hypothetical protein